MKALKNEEISKRSMDITGSDFTKRVVKEKLPVLVEFWASWCLPCQASKAMMKELTKKYQGKIRVYQVNVDQNPVLLEKWQVRSVPTFMLFKDGKEIDRLVGAQTSKTLDNLVQQEFKE